MVDQKIYTVEFSEEELRSQGLMNEAAIKWLGVPAAPAYFGLCNKYRAVFELSQQAAATEAPAPRSQSDTES